MRLAVASAGRLGAVGPERISAASVNSTVPRRAGHGARSGGGGEIKSTTDQQDSDRHGGGEVAVVDRVKPTTTSPPAVNCN